MGGQNISFQEIVDKVSENIKKAYLIKFNNSERNFSIKIVHAENYDKACEKLILKYPNAYKITNWTIE